MIIVFIRGNQALKALGWTVAAFSVMIVEHTFPSWMM